MCFYDQYEFACKDFRWGNFRAHCNKEYRRGETCGMKLVNEVIHQPKDCSLCEKIATKTRRYWSYETKIQQWEREGRLAELSATVEKYRADQMEVRKAIEKLNNERNERAQAIGRYVRGGNGSGSNGCAYSQQSYGGQHPAYASSTTAYSTADEYSSYGNEYDDSGSSDYTFGYNT